MPTAGLAASQRQQSPYSLVTVQFELFPVASLGACGHPERL